MYCDELKSVTIPKSVTAIGSNAFTSCWGLTDVYSYITDPSSLSVGYVFFNVFGYSDYYPGRTLHVPQGTADAYRADEYWCPFFGKIVDDLKKGDMNCDFEVNIVDINQVIDMTMGGNFNAAGDVNDDGEVNIADINAIIDAILK